MLFIQLGKFGEARVYRDEAMPGSFTGHELTVEAPSPRAKPAVQTLVGLDAMVPRGGRIEYGFLGGKVELAADVWSVHVLSASHDPGLPLLSGLVKDAHIGLPAEYATRVLRSLGALGGAQLCGRISIDHGAHSLTGSSPCFYEKLAVTWFTHVHPRGSDRCRETPFRS